MRKLIAGNWKMNGLAADTADRIRAIRDGAAGLGCDLLICPPHTRLAAAAALLAGGPVALGGQDCHAEAHGAHTGDVSAPMLRDAGASWVILGHSERRQNHGESDDLVRSKVLAALAAGLQPIVCVGETLDQRQTGRETEIVGWQLAGSLPDGFRGVIAYEPVWAIGTGRTPTDDEIATMHAFIREELRREFGTAADETRILYGGSVKSGNARSVLAIANVDGALVGGASLDAAAFLAIAGGAG